MDWILIALLFLIFGIYVVWLLVHNHRPWLGIVLGALIASSPFVAFLIVVFWTVETQRVETFGLGLGVLFAICTIPLEIFFVIVAGFVMVSLHKLPDDVKHNSEREGLE